MVRVCLGDNSVCRHPWDRNMWHKYCAHQNHGSIESTSGGWRFSSLSISLPTWLRLSFGYDWAGRIRYLIYHHDSIGFHNGFSLVKVTKSCWPLPRTFPLGRYIFYETCDRCPIHHCFAGIADPVFFSCPRRRSRRRRSMWRSDRFEGLGWSL